LNERNIRGLPSAEHPSRGSNTRKEQAERNIHRSPKDKPLTVGPIREGDEPEFIRDEFGHVRPSRAERNRALLTSHTDTSSDIEDPYSAGREYDPTKRPAEGRKSKGLSQHARRENRSVTAGERAEGAGIDTSVPFPGVMTQPNPEDMEALYAQEAIQDAGGGENKGMKQPRKSIENSLLKLIKEGEIIPSKVGMTKENATKDLEKVVLPQTMGQKPGVMNPVAKRTAPLAAQSSLPSAAESEAGCCNMGLINERVILPRG